VIRRGAIREGKNESAHSPEYFIFCRIRIRLFVTHSNYLGWAKTRAAPLSNRISWFSVFIGQSDERRFLRERKLTRGWLM
jgi:hypothetical protein